MEIKFDLNNFQTNRNKLEEDRFGMTGRFQEFYQSKTLSPNEELDTSELLTFERNIFKLDTKGRASKIVDNIDCFNLKGDLIVAISNKSTIFFVDYNTGKKISSIDMSFDEISKRSTDLRGRVYFFTFASEIPMYVAIFEQTLWHVDLITFTKRQLIEDQIYSYYYKTSTLLGNGCIIYITHKDELVVYNLRTRKVLKRVDPGFSLYSVSDYYRNVLYCGGAERVMKVRIDVSEDGSEVLFQKEFEISIGGNAYTVTFNQPKKQIIIGTSKGNIVICKSDLNLEEENGDVSQNMIILTKKVVPSIIPGLICSGNKVLIISFFLKFIRIFDIVTEEVWNSEERHLNDVNTIIWVDKRRKKKVITAGDDGGVILWKSRIKGSGGEFFLTDMEEQDMKERINFLFEEKSMAPYSKIFVIDDRLRIKTILNNVVFTNL